MIFNNFDKFIDKFGQAYGKGLPGQESQYIMAPKYRPIHSHEEIMNFSPRMSSVLVLFYPVDNVPHIVLMLRQSYDGVHSGQVSFPGGGFEEGEDENLIQTALREAQEEVNVRSSQVSVLGDLTELYIPPSNFYVFPKIGLVSATPTFQKEEKEVAEIIEMPVRYLMDSAPNPKVKISITKEYNIFTPAFEFQKHTIWGATAMILSELKTILHRID